MQGFMRLYVFSSKGNFRSNERREEKKKNHFNKIFWLADGFSWFEKIMFTFF